MPMEKTITSDGYITGIQNMPSEAQITSKRQSLISEGMIREPESSILCDGFEVDNILDEFGTEVVVRVVSKTFDDEYGDATETYTDVVRKAMVQSYSASDDEVKEGQFKAGEVVFSFKKSDEGYIIPGNRIKYGPDWYEIKRIDRQPLVDVLYYLQARVQKI